MLRKFILGATVLGFNSMALAGKSDMQFSSMPEVPQAKYVNDRGVAPASWADESSPSIVSKDMASDSWGKFQPCCDTTSCDTSGCDGMGSQGGLLGLGVFPGLTGLIKRSEGCYDDFISPITNPVYFEDPRQVTEARALFINHNLPTLLGNPGGRIQLYALQIRVRLSENLSLIAVKDGYAVSQSPILDDGWADISAGLKYSLFRDAAAGQLLSVGARFEVPTGMARTLQGNGDGVLDVFASGGTRIGSSGHYLTTSGFVLPMDRSEENQFWYWSNHLDKRIGATNLYALTELNWFHYMNDSKTFPVALEGGDLFNLGSPGIEGHDLVTNAYGVRYKPNRHLESGCAFEFPLTEKKGLMENRLTADLIIRY